MDARKARLLATTSAWALIAALGGGCATSNEQTSFSRGTPRSGEQGASVVPRDASGPAVRSYRKVRDVRTVPPAEEQPRKIVAPRVPPAVESPPTAMQAEPVPPAPARAAEPMQPPQAPRANSSATAVAPDLPTTPVQPRHGNLAGPQRFERPPARSEPLIEPPENDPAAPLPETFTAPGSRASITPTMRSGGGIVTGAAKAGANNERPTSQPMDPQQARPVAMPGMSSRELNGIQQVSDARKLLERGRIVEARAALESAISLVPSLALHELGRTYDPYYLGLLTSIDEGSEPRTAATFYTEAIVYGSPTAGIDLNRLKASHQALR